LAATNLDKQDTLNRNLLPRH